MADRTITETIVFKPYDIEDCRAAARALYHEIDLKHGPLVAAKVLVSATPGSKRELQRRVNAEIYRGYLLSGASMRAYAKGSAKYTNQSVNTVYIQLQRLDKLADKDPKFMAIVQFQE